MVVVMAFPTPNTSDTEMENAVEDVLEEARLSGANDRADG